MNLNTGVNYNNNRSLEAALTQLRTSRTYSENGACGQR